MKPASTPESTARVTVVSGPTAVGKGTVAQYVREHFPQIRHSVSATTRAPRPGEIDGVHYAFVSDADFDRMVDEQAFLEWATVHNAYRYGTPRGPITLALADGKSVLENSMIVYGCGNSDGNRHTHVNLPIVLAGGGGGTLTPGRYQQLIGFVRRFTC